MSSLPNDPVPLYDFNPGTKTWKIHAHKISSITNGNLVLQADGENSEIYFAQKNNEIYKISDLLASGSIDYVTVNSNPGLISIGQYAGQNAGTNGNIAIGHYASFTNSGNSSLYRIAIGYEAGYSQQLAYSIAIGYQSGKTNQGQNCISIGNKAGETNQTSNSIILNATGTALNAANTGFFVNPIRSNGNNTNLILCHDTTTNEIKRSGINISGTDLTNANVVSAQNFNIGGSNVISASRQGNFTDLELKNNNGTKLLIYGDTGDITTWGTLSIDNIIEKTSGSGVTIGGNINITGSNLTNANVVSAQNFNIGGTNVISAARQGNFTDLELKNNNGTKLLIDGDTGNITAWGTLSIDNIIEKTSGSGVTIQSNLKIQGNTTGGSGVIELNCENNSHAVKIKGPPHSAGATYTLTLPNDVGTDGYVLKTDGTGNLSWTEQTGGDGGVNHLTIEDSPGGIFIGQNTAANILSSDNVISIGNYAGNNVSTATTDRIAIGNSAGYTEQQTYSICIGTSAGQMGGSSRSVIIGYRAGMWWPGSRSVFIGEEAGYNGSSSEGVQIGYRAGYQSAGYRSIGIGPLAASTGQGNHSIYIGDEAGATGLEKTGVIGIGNRAGNTHQLDYSIAIGTNAGWLYQNTRCVAIGLSAGRSNQGAYSVAIGCQAGNTDQAANSIVLNAQTDTDLNTTNSGFYVKPIRDNASSSGHKLVYDNGTGEITYQPDSGGGGGGGVSELNDLTDAAVNYNLTSLILGSSVPTSTSYPIGNLPRWTIVVAAGIDNPTYGEGCTFMGTGVARHTSKVANYNTAFGHESFRHGIGIENTAIGKYSIFGNSGSYNVGVGSDTLSGGSGSKNVSIGHGSSHATVNGSENICIGYYANRQDMAGSNNIIIGASSQASSTSVNNEITLGNSNNNLFRMPGLNGSNGDVLTYNNGYIEFASGGSGGGGGGVTTAFFSATFAGSVGILNYTETPIVWLSPSNDPGPGTDATNINCNSAGVTWSNGEVTIPISGVYVIQLATMTHDQNYQLNQAAAILEKQIAGTSIWLKQTEIGWVNYDGGADDDLATHHTVGSYMGQFNIGDKLRLVAYAHSKNHVSTDLRLIEYRGGTSYLRGHLIHAT